VPSARRPRGGDDVSSRNRERNRAGHAAQAARRGVARILGCPPGSHADGPRGTTAPRARRTDLSRLHLKNFLSSCYRACTILQALFSPVAAVANPFWSFGTPCLRRRIRRRRTHELGHRSSSCRSSYLRRLISRPTGLLRIVR